MPATISKRSRHSPAAGLFASFRLHQWAKNLLVFAPMILGGEIDDRQIWLAAFLAFIAMGLVSSSTYLINDVLDVEDDRKHWSKRERPVAKGILSTRSAWVFASLGLIAGLALGAYVSIGVLIVLLSYVLLTLAYSFYIKRIPLMDGLLLAVLFTLRLALGTVAVQVEPSPWLFVFSMFLFTSLSLAKRYAELDRSNGTRAKRISGRGYRLGDAPLVMAVGLAAGLSAVIIMIFYIIEDAFRESFEGNALSLWGFPPIVFLLVCRIWLVTVRGQMHDDPVKFMLEDRASYLLAILLAICFAFAWFD